MKKDFKKMRKFLCIFLAMVLVFTLWTPISAEAATNEIASKKTEIQVGETIRLRISGLSWRTTWESSDESIVEVSSNGTIKGVSRGEATVTATSRTFGWIFTHRERTQKFEIIVIENETSESETVQLSIGESITLDSPSKSRTTWESSDANIAEVSSTGTVTGVSSGDAVITARYKTGGFHFWFINWGGRITTTKYLIRVVDSGEAPVPDPDPTPTPDPDPEVKEYTITFESNGGSEVDTQIIISGELVSVPKEPVKDGFIFGGWYLDENLTEPYDFASPVLSDITLYAKWKEVSAEVPSTDLSIDMSDFSYNEEQGWFVIAEKIDQLSGSLKAEDSVDSMTLTVKDAKNNLLLAVDVPAEENWKASRVGFAVGENIVSVEADIDGTIISDEVRVYNMLEENMTNLDIDSGDNDQDGLNNYWELFYGTDADKADTDSDGLSDYYEVYNTGTSPLKEDTDGNNIPDGEEDFDKDSVINLIESQNSGDPYIADTDNDGLDDSEEIKYGTALNLSDTDADGISDYMEVMVLNTDPLKDEGEGSQDFVYSKTYETESAVKPMVEITAQGNVLESLEISSVDTESGFLTSSLPGFISAGYDITLDGEFSSAAVYFEIEDDFFESEEFVPAVYYFNEEMQRLERVAEQRVEGHQVIAQLEHFSSYIVLNESKYIKVMNGGGKYDEIAKTDSDGDGLPDVLENNGIIMQNGLYFYTLANNPDSDGDGLKDGEEIGIQVNDDGSWYGIMYSNPNLQDSDGDGATDDEEKDRGSSAMYSDMETADVEMIMNNNIYTSSDFRSDFDTSIVNQIAIISDSIVFQNCNYPYIYKKMLLQYFEGHAEELYQIKLQGTYKAAINAMVNWIASVNSMTSTTDPEKIRFVEEKLREAKYIQINSEQIGKANDLLKDVFGFCSAVYEKLGEDIPAGMELTIGGAGVSDILKISGNAFDAADEIGDVIEIYGQIDANAAVLREHTNVFRYIAEYTEDIHLKAASQELMVQVNTGIKETFMIRDGLLNLTSNLLIGTAIEELTGIKGTVASVLKVIDEKTDWSLVNFNKINENAIKVLGYAGAANAIADGMKNAGLIVYSGDYTPVTNKAVYDLYVLLMMRQEAEDAWYDALPYRSTSSEMEKQYEENKDTLKKIKEKYEAGEYGFSFGSFSASPRQGICGYISFPENTNCEVYAYKGGNSNPCAMDYTGNGTFFLSLDDGTYDIQIVSSGFENHLIEDIEVQQNVISAGSIALELVGADPGDELIYETFDLYADGADDKFQAVLINNTILTLLGHTDSKEYRQYGISNETMDAYFMVPIDENGNFGMSNPSEDTWNLLDLSYFPDGEHIFYFMYLDDQSYMYKYSGRPIIINVENGQAHFVQTESRTYNEQMLKDLNTYDINDFLIPEEHESITEDDMQMIRNKAEEITAGISNDYYKAKAIYEWVCENITYDANSSGDSANQLPQNVLKTGKAVCDGYAQVTQALLISIDIPCAFITGYSPGNNEDYLHDNSNLFMDYPNHAWNAAYIDGRWVLIETTWGNQVINGRILLGDFDTHLDAFTTLHRYEQIGRVVITENTADNQAA